MKKKNEGGAQSKQNVPAADIGVVAVCALLSAYMNSLALAGITQQ